MGSSHVGGDPRRRMSEVRYARSAHAHVAYRVFADAATARRDVILVLSGTMPMDALLDDPVALRFVEGLADLGRLVVFDRCGIGLSDPPPDANSSVLTQWCTDLEAVIAATDVAQPVLVTQGLGAATLFLYSERHSGAVSSLVLLSPGIRPVDDDTVRRQIAGEWDSVALWFPSRAEEPGFREWFIRAGQRGASPGRAAHTYPTTGDDDLLLAEVAAARVETPTLVLRRPEHPMTPSRTDDPILALVPGAVRVDVPGQDMFAWGGEVDALIAEVTRFVTGEHRSPAPERTLAAVLYSDIVASTDRATLLGDTRWRRVLDRHDEAARACIGRRGGTVVKTTGDGILAVLPSATNALRAARELLGAVREQGLEVRVGIHVGDIDRRGDDISGINVVIGARILSLAGPGEILMSHTALDAIGESVEFESRGEQRLKGVSGRWMIFSIVDP